jgi:hypothetical protein
MAHETKHIINRGVLPRNEVPNALLRAACVLAGLRGRDRRKAGASDAKENTL